VLPLLAEILGAVAVVDSLVFAAVSINRNTEQLQASGDNFLIQLQDEQMSDLALSPGLASIAVKFLRNEELNEVEELQYRETWDENQLRGKPLLFDTSKDSWAYRLGKLGVESCPSRRLSDLFRCSARSGTPLCVNLRGVLFSVRPVWVSAVSRSGVLIVCLFDPHRNIATCRLWDENISQQVT